MLMLVIVYSVYLMVGGEVIEQRTCAPNYPFVVKFDDSMETYTLDGRTNTSFVSPSCWLEADVLPYYLDMFPAPKKIIDG